MLNVIGKTVLFNNGNKFNVISQVEDKIYLNDGKSCYSLKIAITKGFLVFEDTEFQSQVLQYFKQEAAKSAKLAQQKADKILNDMLIETAFNIWEGCCQKQNIASNYISNNFTCLEAGNAYGKQAKVIYENCCKNLGFAWSKAGLFAQLKILFAQHATKEDYSVWMLPHSNLTNSTNGTWINVIQGDHIYEFWTKPDDYVNGDIRATFAKQENGYYVFMGVYKLIKIDPVGIKKCGCTLTIRKTFERINTIYP